MAFEISIETDTRLTRARFVELVEAYGAEPEDQGRKVRVYFPVSEAWLWFHEVPAEPLRADIVPELNWEIGSVMTFRFAYGRSQESHRELDKFLEFLAAGTAAFFVATVDYSSLWALRDEAGLRFFPM